MAAIRTRFISLVLLLSMILSGCCTTCPNGRESSYQVEPETRSGRAPTRGEPRLNPFLQETITQRELKRYEELERTASRAGRIADPVTVGLVFIGLNQLKKDLDEIVKTASGEAKSIVISLSQNVQAVADQINYDLGRKLEYTFDRLDTTERQMMEDANHLLQLGQRVARDINVQVTETVRITAHEADITAYNALYAVPCRDQKARVVYNEPRVIRAGVDSGNIQLRGNFLQFTGPPSLNGKTVSYSYLNPSEMLVTLPKEAYLEDPSDPKSGPIQSEKHIQIGVPVGECRPHFLFSPGIDNNKSTNNVDILVKPAIEIGVHVQISATARVGKDTSRDVGYYRWEPNCDAEYADPQSFCFEGGKKATSQDIGITTANCGSGFDRAPELQGNCCYVYGRIKGCGTNWVVNCKGHGWLGYSGHVKGRFYDPAATEIYETSQLLSNQPSGQFTFQYPADKIPDDIEDGSFKWHYTVVVTVKEGNKTSRYEVNELQPNTVDVTSRMDLHDRNNRVLSVQVNTELLRSLQK